MRKVRCTASNPKCFKANGIFFPNSHVRLADITDGPSNTMLVMEVQTKLNSKMPGGDRWYNFAQNGDSNPPKDISESLIGTENNDPINGGSHEAAGSFHVGGCNMLFGDGRVQFLSQNINMTNLPCIEHPGEGRGRLQVLIRRCLILDLNKTHRQEPAGAFCTSPQSILLNARRVAQRQRLRRFRASHQDPLPAASRENSRWFEAQGVARINDPGPPPQTPVPHTSFFLFARHTR